jgi:hypothetical protein
MKATPPQVAGKPPHPIKKGLAELARRKVVRWGLVAAVPFLFYFVAYPQFYGWYHSWQAGKAQANQPSPPFPGAISNAPHMLGAGLLTPSPGPPGCARSRRCALAQQRCALAQQTSIAALQRFTHPRGAAMDAIPVFLMQRDATLDWKQTIRRSPASCAGWPTAGQVLPTAAWALPPRITTGPDFRRCL